jgi:hypothetical protein
MCGELDEEQDERQFEEKLQARFQMNAQELLKDAAQLPQETPADPGLYMEKLFCDVLERCARDSDQAGEGKRYDRLALQPVVFARLAGLLAGHLSLGEDPLRKLIEALMSGYAESEAMDRARQQRYHHHGDVIVSGS